MARESLFTLDWLVCIGVFFLVYVIFRYLAKLTLHKFLKNEFALTLKAPVRAFVFTGAFAVATTFSPSWFQQHVIVLYGLKILFITVGFWIVVRGLTVLLSSHFLPVSLTDSTRVLFLTLIRASFSIIGTLIVMDTVGISITPLLASLGVGSLAVALALQDTFNNFFSGLYLLIDKPIRIGDNIKTEDGTEGVVVKIGWRSTHIQQSLNNMVIVPNSKLSSSRLTNFDIPSECSSFHVSFHVGYESNLEHVERITSEAVRAVILKSSNVSKDEPIIRFTSMGDLGVQVTVTVSVKTYSDVGPLKHELIKTLHQRYITEQIRFPIKTL